MSAAGALSLARAVERLCNPFTPEELSPALGEAVLWVDLEAPGEEPKAEDEARALAALASLPCPSVAFGAAPGGAAERLAARCDLHVEDEAELELALAGARRAPIAASALAQLLRHGERLDVEGGLVAESLTYSMLQTGPEFGAWLQRRERRVRPPLDRPAVRIEREGDVLRLTLDRPAKRNAFSAEMRDALVEGLRVAVADPSVREVVLAGEGPAFCAGGDLDEFGTLPDPATAHAIRSTRSAGRWLAACASRVRADLHGACVGAGIELPAFAGRVVAHRDAFFELPEVGMGLVPGAGGTVSIPRRIGRQRAAYLALSGTRIDAATALRWGLIDQIRD